MKSILICTLMFIGLSFAYAEGAHRTPDAQQAHEEKEEPKSFFESRGIEDMQKLINNIECPTSEKGTERTHDEGAAG